MPEPFDVYEYAAYLRARWKFFAAACGSAALIAMAASMLLPKRYTATVTLVIEPGGDPRSASVVSPVYLESLRTYETFATSDVTFQRALDKFHLRDAQPDAPLESMKKNILEVAKLRDTRILQISATLTSPRDALAFAQFIASETVNLNQSVSRQAEEDSITEAGKEFSAAQAARDKAEAEWASFKERGAIETLQEEITSLLDSKTRLHRQSMAANVEVAGLESQSANPKGDIAAARAKMAALAKQDAEANREFDVKNKYLAQTVARRDALQDALDETRKSYQRAETRVQDLRSAAGFHGERLRIIDTGAVPSRPSSPKTIRNIEAALLLSLVAALVYLSMKYTARRTAGEPAASYRLRA